MEVDGVVLKGLLSLNMGLPASERGPKEVLSMVAAGDRGSREVFCPKCGNDTVVRVPILVDQAMFAERPGTCAERPGMGGSLREKSGHVETT